MYFFGGGGIDGWKVLPLRLTQSWIGIRRGSGEEDTLPVELSYASHDAPIECGIHQETIGEIDRNLSNGNLPHSWDVNDIEGVVNVATIKACGHTFHVSALAYFFLSMGMTCPQCRSGIHGYKLKIEWYVSERVPHTAPLPHSHWRDRQNRG